MIRWLRRLGKRLAAGLLGALLSLLRRRRAPSARIERALVVRIDQRVGNVLLTSPLITALQAAWPDVELQVLVAPSKASILEGIVPTIPFDKRGWGRPLAFLRSLLALRRQRFDVAIDASHWHSFSVTSAALTAWTGAPIRVAHDRGPIHRFANRLVPPPEVPEAEVRTKLRLLDPLDVPAGPARMQTGLGLGAAADRMGEFLDGNGLAPPKLVGIAPGGRKLDHRAPTELFAALGRRARALGYAVVVLWGPGEEGFAGEVAEQCGGKLAPPTSLDELAALMRACRLVVANDTGPMHLSVACRTSTLALFRGADPVRWGHAWLGHEVVEVDDDDPEGTEARARSALERALTADETLAAPP